MSFQVSFAVSPDCVAGRMGLLITLVLVLINLFVKCTQESPNADSFTSVSTWITFCIFMICLAISEYGCILFVNHCSRYFSKEKRNRTVVFGYTDTIFLLICIFLFVTFNIIYWWPKRIDILATD